MKIINVVKLAVILLCLVAVSFLSNAQVIRRDVVYLKNGSIIKGSVIEMIPNGNIKIKTSDGSIFVYKMEDVEKTEKEEISAATTQTYSNGDLPSDQSKKHDLKHKGIFIVGRIGPALKGLEDDETGIDITGGIISGYQINKYISVGLGFETMSYAFGDQPKTSVRAYPVFLDTRIYIPRTGNVQPMFFCQFGYAAMTTPTVDYNSSSGYSPNFTPTSGGAFLALGAGMRIAASQRISLLVDGGFSFQTLEGKDDSYSYQSSYTYSTTSTTSKTMVSMRLNLGVMINLSR